VKTTIFCWLLLLSVPGCLLLQPLDEAKPEVSAGGPNGGSAGGANGGSAGKGNGSSGGPSKAGNGSAGGDSPAAGAANGGGPSETDFSLFTGTWLVQEGSTIERSCSDGEDYSNEVDWTADEFVEGGGGSSGDILLNPMTPCALAFDVDDRIAYAQSGQSCTLSDGDSLEQTLEFTSAAFAVDDDESTATASVEVDETISDASGTLYCTAYWTLYYQRGAN
jgi:hypothetical protein